MQMNKVSVDTDIDNKCLRIKQVEAEHHAMHHAMHHAIRSIIFDQMKFQSSA